MLSFARCLCSIVFLLITFITSGAWCEGPFLSSKAIRISLQAKKAVESHDEKAIVEGVEQLQSLLRESSFRRLDPESQVHILLLLSKGLERLERYKEQEELLLSYAKKEELYRFQVPLKSTLARSFIQQHRFADAERLLVKMIKSSCAHLPLEEKSALADVLIFRDEYIHLLLRHGDRLAESGKWEEARKLYETVLTTVDLQQIPNQTSLLEKKRLRQKLLLRIAEVHFCLGHFQEVVTILHDWDEMIFLGPSCQPLLTRRLFLIASSYHALGQCENAHRWFQCYFSSPYVKRPFLDKHVWCSPLHIEPIPKEDSALSPPLLLWKAHEALETGSSEALGQAITLLQSRVRSGEPILHILKGFFSALEHNLPTSVEELMAGLSKPTTSLDASWREAGLHLLAECGFERMMLLVLSNQSEKAVRLAQQLIPLCSTATQESTLLRTGAIHLFLYHTLHDPASALFIKNILLKIDSAQKAPNAPLYSLLCASQEQPPTQRSFDIADTLSISDRFFALWLGASDMSPSAGEVISWATLDDIQTPFARYCAALCSYHQALADEIPSEPAVASLHRCLDDAGLDDVRPQVLHCLIDLSIHASQWAEADELIHDLISEHPTYPSLPQAILSCIFAFEEAPSFADERVALTQYLLGKDRSDIYTLLLILHLFETRQQLPLDQNHPLASFSLTLIARSEARASLSDAEKSKEPSVIKEHIENAVRACIACRAHALETLKTLPDSESKNVVWGVVFGIENDQIELLERYITTSSAFNELPSLLEVAGRTFLDDLRTYHSSIPPQHQQISPSFLSMCSCCAHTSDLYAATFHRQLDEALEKAKSLPESWLLSRQAIRSIAYLAKTLREANRAQEALDLVSQLREKEMSDEIELALEIAMEKSLCLRELHRPDKAMAQLAWVINGPYASSLRVKAMILRAELYLSLHRTDLAIRQLESVAAKGGEWGAVAERKLRELYGTD